MRKRVVKEEPLGNSPAVKVIYDDGTFGVRGIGSDPSPAQGLVGRSQGFQSPASQEPSYQSTLSNLESRGILDRGEILREPEVQALQNYMSRAHKDFLDENVDPKDHDRLLQSLKEELMNEKDPWPYEDSYNNWLDAYRASAKGTP